MSVTKGIQRVRAKEEQTRIRSGLCLDGPTSNVPNKRDKWNIKKNWIVYGEEEDDRHSKVLPILFIFFFVKIICVWRSGWLQIIILPFLYDYCQLSSRMLSSSIGELLLQLFECHRNSFMCCVYIFWETLERRHIPQHDKVSIIWIREIMWDRKLKSY